jgi:hypothetical protein
MAKTKRKIQRPLWDSEKSKDGDDPSISTTKGKKRAHVEQQAQK